MPLPAPNITEAIAASIQSNLVTAFDAAVSGSTGASKVRRGVVLEVDASGDATLVPWCVWDVQSRSRNPEHSNMDQDAPDGFVDITVAAIDAAGVHGADQAGEIAAQIESRLTPANVTATGFTLHSLRCMQNAPRADTVPRPAHYYRDMSFYFTAYPA